MRDEFELQIDQLRHSVAAMGEQTQRMLADALSALVDGDLAKVDQVVATDELVDRAYEQIQHGVLATIALHGPVGHDLRLLTAIVHVSLHLERMGDYAVNAARTIRRSSEQPGDRDLTEQLAEMGALAGEVAELALRSFLQIDVVLAREAAVRDDGVDRLNLGIFHRLVRLAGTDEDRIEWAARMIQLTRQLERFADHGVDIAEQVPFVATGEITELLDRDTD